MSGYETTIAEGSNGQLLVTVPKQIAKSMENVGRGTKVLWKIRNGKLKGEVLS